MHEFSGVDLRGARFEHVDLTGADLHAVDLSRARVRGAHVDGLVMRGVECVDLRIDGEIGRLVVNGVDVGAYVAEQMERRDPVLARMRPVDAAGFRAAWALLEELWEGTVDRARSLDPDLLHASVDGEWSFTQTLRHLAFATDAWVGRAVLGDPSPWHPLDLPWEEMADTPGIPRDRSARPALTEVLDLRRDRQRVVREYLAGLTDEELDTDTEPVEGSSWPPPQSFPVRECLSVVLNEEYFHRRFAERDLDVLTGDATT
ncbi:DinB family protein [Kineococcus sp. SYSU DK003]|uniref:DinB family protein n=1 Tax=Kineococcus sp. SYSU DK003 TaxID=3383124 RepID=UPI003D7CE36C